MNKITLPRERRKEKRSKIHTGVEETVCRVDEDVVLYHFSKQMMCFV